MATIGLSRQNYGKIGFLTLVAIFGLWIISQAVGQLSVSGGDEATFSNVVSEAAAVSYRQASEPAATSPVQPAAGKATEAQAWFIVDDESRWTAQEMIVVEQILAHTWQALDGAGVDGQALLDGYRFRRVAGEFVPDQERYLAMVDHQEMEIVLADGAFARLHGFYIYHEVGHAVDRQLERTPSEAYHRIAGQVQEAAAEGGDVWSTATGFWLRYHGRDDREEATADAFAWWVMSQAEQPKPFFPGTPPVTDYDQIARTIEEAVREAAAVDARAA